MPPSYLEGGLIIKIAAETHQPSRWKSASLWNNCADDNPSANVKSALFQHHTAILLHHHHLLQRFGNKKQKQLNCVTKIISLLFSQSWFNEISHPETWNISMGRFCISPPDASSLPHGWVTTTFSALTTADSGHTINSLRSSVSPGQPSHPGESLLS